MDNLPKYMHILWNKIYDNAKFSEVLDDNRIAWLASLGFDEKITDDMLKDIAKNAHVLQIGITFGNEIEKVYKKVFCKGKLDIFDACETQINLAKKKYKHHNIKIINHDATLPWDEKYDVIICYKLLGELPLTSRNILMKNVLDGLAVGGKALFIDYANPQWYNPLRPFLKIFNLLYRPMTDTLWSEPLENFCDKKNEFRWRHTYYGGKMLQKTIAIRKILNNEDAKKYTRMFRKK